MDCPRKLVRYPVAIPTKILLTVLILILLKFLYVLVTMNTDPIKCNGAAHDTVAGQDCHEGTRKGCVKHQRTS